MIRSLAVAIAIICCLPSTAHALTCPAHQWVSGAGQGGATRCSQPATGDISGLPTTGTSGHVLPFLDGNNTASGTNIFSGNVYLGGGRPWIDVRSGANGCSSAVGNGATDDQPAIQCQANFLNSTFGGGVLFFPPGTYLVGSTVTIKGGTIIQGVGPAVSNIKITTDIVAVTFDTTASFAGMDRFEVFGNQNGSAANNLVTVGNGALVNFSNCELNGGLNALATNGVDGNMENCTIIGWGSSGGGVFSQGANTYYNARIDQSSVSVTYAFKQGVAYNNGVMENRIVASDMSGNYTDSVIIADTNNNAITHFTDTVFSNVISITGGKYTMFTGDEFGAAVASSVNESVVSSFATGSPLTFTGTGTRNCAGNGSITC